MDKDNLFPVVQESLLLGWFWCGQGFPFNNWKVFKY